MAVLLLIPILLLFLFYLELDKKVEKLENYLLVLNDFKDFYLLSEQLLDIDQKIEDAKDVQNYELCKSLSIIKHSLIMKLDELEIKVYK